MVPSVYREHIRKADPPQVNAMRNAAGKARHARVPAGRPGIVIGADTFLWFEGRMIGKPRSMAEAWRMLRSLRGKSHWVYTGLCLLDTRTGTERVSYDRSEVVFRKVSDAAIAEMFDAVNPLDKAGAYAGQEDRWGLIKAIRGDKNTVIGLPVELLRQGLKELDFSLLTTGTLGILRHK